MRKNLLTLASFVGIALMVSLFSPLRAAAQDGDGDDPPSRVARLSYTQGAVSFQPAGTDDWVDATSNRPITTGDKLWSDNGSRAALHIGSASIHLSQNTGFSFLNLTDNVAQLQLTSGTIRIRVKRLGDDDNFEVDTPNLAFTILAPGIYKISVNDTGDATVIEDVRGQGEVTGGGSSYDVNPGDWDTFSGTDYLSANQDVIDDDDNFNDDFEHWSEQRDHHEDVSISAQYVSDEAIGYDDLDDNGGWRPVPEYGTIWFPHTALVGWAPYHYGHWAYVAPWGYSWVDDAPWGFAPFHYGRWVTVGGAWGWVPCAPRPTVAVYGGPAYVRPYYAPALVAWVGGAGFSVGVGGGGFGAGVNVAWFPLGPREVYVPSYPVSRAYVTNVNISNTRVETTVVNNYYTNVVVNKNVTVTNVTYANQRVPGAVVATSGTAFTGGGSVSKNFVQVDARAVASAPVAAATPPAVPQRAAFTGGRVTANVHPPAAIQARAVVAKTAPPPPPVPVAQRVQAIQQNGGRPLSVAQTRQITPARTASAAPAPAIKVAPPAKPAAPKVIKANTNPAPPPPTNRHATSVSKNPPANASNNAAPNANRPPANNAQPPANNNRPAANTQAPVNNNRPPAQQSPQAPPSQQPAANTQANRPAPPTAHPADEQLEQQHQQQLNNLHQQQDQERQQLEQKQQQERQQLADQKAAQAKQQQQQAQQKEQQDAKQKAGEARQKQLDQQHQQQLEQLQQKHQQEQQQLQQKQEQEHKQAAQQAKPQNKPEAKPKDDKPPKKDN
jgi:DNA segregation ATPase FtsK/SpoIIIE-like protein